jgi:hypothetical protein
MNSKKLPISCRGKECQFFFERASLITHALDFSPTKREKGQNKGSKKKRRLLKLFFCFVLTSFYFYFNYRVEQSKSSNVFISLINTFASLKMTAKCQEIHKCHETRLSVCADVRLAHVIYNRNTIQLYKIYIIFPNKYKRAFGDGDCLFHACEVVLVVLCGLFIYVLC